MQLNSDWKTFLSSECATDSFLNLQNKLLNEYKSKTIYPKSEDLFNAFNLLSLANVKVVILGQDPYHGKNQANGLAFSVSKSAKIPPSLRNIYKELVADMNCDTPLNGDLSKWAGQGVLLINSVLSVEASKANSHANMGWEEFTNAVIQKLSEQREHMVFILWGSFAQKKALLVDETKHFILKSPHPSPLSSYRGFFGSKPFSQTNIYLKQHNLKEIDWCLSAQGTLL